MRGRPAAMLWAVATIVAACGSGSDVTGPGAPDDGGGGDTTVITVGDTSGTEPSATSRPTTIGRPTTTESSPDTSSTSTTTGEPATSTTTEPAQPAEPTVTLTPAAQGDKGDAVVALQDRLSALGFASGASDGSYGRRTAGAVRSFQVVAGLEPTGDADQATVTALASYRYDGPVLGAGDEGPAVAELQTRLADGPFDPGPIDGKFGPATTQAVWALSKLAGMAADNAWGPADEKALELVRAGSVGQPQTTHERRWVVVDLSEQLMKVYDPGVGVPTLVSHISSGNGIPWENEDHKGTSITPKGSFEIYKRISGWRESSLDIGRLYNPLYFTGGIALHGSQSVPPYPASHGCIRVPMHIADYLPGELPNGTPVDVVA